MLNLISLIISIAPHRLLFCMNSANIPVEMLDMRVHIRMSEGQYPDLGWLYCKSAAFWVDILHICPVYSLVAFADEEKWV